MKTLLYLIALIIALIIYVSPILIIIAVISRIVKNTKNAKKQSNNQNGKIIEPQWERVIKEDGTEFYRLKKDGIGYTNKVIQTTSFRKYPYRKKDLLTPTEYEFWVVLKDACNNKNLLICPKVRMEDFINVEVDEYAKKQSHRGKIKSRHIDFMICDSNLNILAGIELDDKSHDKEKAKETDRFKDQVFLDIRIPLYRVKVQNGTNAGYIGEVSHIIEEITK